MSANVEITAAEKENTFEEKCIFEWTINNLQTQEVIRTPVFTPVEYLDAKFYFEIWFRRSKHSRDSLQVVLRKLPGTSIHDNLHSRVFISFHNPNLGIIFAKYKSNNPLNLASITAKILIHFSENPDSFQGRKFILKCQMICFGHLLSPKTYKSLHKFQTLTKNFEVLLQSNAFSDVDIQIGEKTLKGHKLVLAAHSPVFKRMLEQDFLETRLGVITISDFDSAIFESFLKFLYTGEVEEKSFSDIKLLYSLADKYDVQILKDQCVQTLRDTDPSEDQIDEIRQMAIEYKDDILENVAKSLLINYCSSLLK